jgi:SRSO17 transposase
MYLQGLLSDVERKNAEAIAYRHDEDRQGLQTYLGTAPWDYQPLLEELACQVATALGEPDGVIVFDPSAFPKKGRHSVAVARQWCGRLGKVENCQVGIFMGYVARSEHALVDVRLYVPREWTKDRRRRKECGIPQDLRYQTRHEMVLDMLRTRGPLLPHGWVAGDDEMGRPASFRQELRDRGEQYLLAVPSNTTIRDLEATPPEYSGHGPHPKVPFMRVDRWCAAQPESAWTKLDVRDGEKGPLVIDVMKHRIQARTAKQGTGPEELLFITRERQADGTFKHDYYLSNGKPETSLKELGRVAKLAHRVEECIKRGKSEAGLADYQVRNWSGWHRHQTLSLLAAWFLNQETRRGKNPDTRTDHAAPEGADRGHHRGIPQRQRPRGSLPSQHALARAQRTRAVLPPPLSQNLASLEEPTQNLGIQ